MRFFWCLVLLAFILGIGIIIVASVLQAIPAFIAGYLISPWGLPIIAKVEYFNERMKEI